LLYKFYWQVSFGYSKLSKFLGNITTIKKLLNPNVVSEAFDVPLVICTSRKKPKRLLDFVAVQQFSISEELKDARIILSTIVGRKSNAFKAALQRRNATIASIDKKYVLRVFSDYLENP